MYKTYERVRLEGLAEKVTKLNIFKEQINTIHYKIVGVFDW